MTVQTIELSGQRYVILPEREFLELQRPVAASTGQADETPGPAVPKFRDVVPLKVGGMPASEMLIRDRR